MATKTRTKIKELLIRRLQTMAIDGKLPSDREFAKEFNVAFLTINRVMRELQWEGYVVRRPRLGTFLASKERSVANEHDDQGNLGSVAVIYPNYFSFHFWQHVRYVEEFAVKNRLRLLEFKLNQDSTYDRALAYARQADNLRGALMLPIPDSLNDETLGRLDSLGCPLVLLSTHGPLGNRKNLYCMNVDSEQQGKLAAETLLAKGHRKLAWVQNEPSPNPLVLKGMLGALRANGLRATDLTCIGRGIRAWENSREAGYRLTCQLLDTSDATGVYFDSAAGPAGAMRALSERGLRCPDDISMVSPCSQSGDEDYFIPPLTSLEWDWREEVRLAFEIILGRTVSTEREMLFPARLVEKSSIAAPRQITTTA